MPRIELTPAERWTLDALRDAMAQAHTQATQAADAADKAQAMQARSAEALRGWLAALGATHGCDVPTEAVYAGGVLTWEQEEGHEGAD